MLFKPWGVPANRIEKRKPDDILTANCKSCGTLLVCERRDTKTSTDTTLDAIGETPMRECPNCHALVMLVVRPEVVLDYQI